MYTLDIYFPIGLSLIILPIHDKVPLQLDLFIYDIHVIICSLKLD